jgi:hypothetical protein
MGSGGNAADFVCDRTSLGRIAVVGQSIEQGRCHLGVAEHTRPFTEGEIGGDDDRCSLVEAADEVEQELATGLREWTPIPWLRGSNLHAE